MIIAVISVAVDAAAIVMFFLCLTSYHYLQALACSLLSYDACLFFFVFKDVFPDRLHCT